MTKLSELKTAYKKATAKGAHHTWDEAKIEAKLNELNGKTPAEVIAPLVTVAELPEAKEEKKEKKHLKPISSSLFIPGVGSEKGVTIQRKDWTDAHTEQYKSAYVDRKKKAMKKLA